MEKEELAKKYGKERCSVVYNFFVKISIYYGFNNSDMSFEFLLEDLKKFSNEDIHECLEKLKMRKSYQKLQFNEIYETCSSIKRNRAKKEEKKEIVNKIEKEKVEAIIYKLKDTFKVVK